MKKLILALYLFTLPTLVLGDAVNLYRGETTVNGKEAAERRQAFPSALENVLVKISGVRDFTEYPAAQGALRGAESLVLSYFYRNQDVPLAEGAVREELRLVVEFSPPGVDELVRQIGLPVWPEERNPVETWVVLDQGMGRQILPQERQHDWEAMAEVARQRGLPLRWPDADEEGMYPVDAQLLWGGYTEDLGASSRTGVMIVAARQEGLNWSVRSNLEYRGQVWAWRQQNEDLQAALLDVMQQAADNVASTQAIAATDLGSWQHDMTITGITGAEDYAAVLKELADFSMVDQVSVAAASPGRMTFRLRLNALPRYFEEALDGNRHLVLQEGEEQYAYKR